MGPDRRKFIPWTMPFLKGVVEELSRADDVMDFSNVMIVVAGGRAKRRLQALLADRAAERGVAMYPPRVVTMGDFQSVVGKVEGASGLARRLAWAAALKKLDTARQLLFPRLSLDSELGQWMGAARLLEDCQVELAAGGLRFGDVAGRCENDRRLGNAERWSAAGALYERYLEELKNAGLADPQEARLAAIESGRIRCPQRVIVAGVLEINRPMRQLLELLGDCVEVMVHAPKEMASEFDEWGAVRVERWVNKPIDLEPAALVTAAGFNHQSEACFAAIGRIEPPPRADEVTVVVPDDRVVPFLETTAENLGNINVRYGGGVGIGRTRPFRLLACIAEFMRWRDYGDFARLVLLPDVTAFLQEHRKVEPADWRDWRTLLDEYGEEYLPGMLDMAQASEGGWKFDEREHPSKDSRASLAWLYRAVCAMLGGLIEAEGTAKGGLNQWAGRILEILKRAYGAREWNTGDPAQRMIVESVGEFRAGLDELLAAGELKNLPPLVTAEEAIRLLLSQIGGKRIPPPSNGNEVELLGWLEVPADDAEHLIVTGFNEGLIPETIGPGPFLNDSVRGVLGLTDDGARYARDAYILTAAIASRAKHCVTLISGRTAADGEPLMPSRLLFACDARTMAQRVARVAGGAEGKGDVSLAYRFGPASASAFIKGTGILPVEKRIESMKVTSFRDYIDSPRGFYLKHVLGLKTLLGQSPRELTRMKFGNVVHEVMKQFGTTPLKEPWNRRECEEAIGRIFETYCAKVFSANGVGPPAVRFGLELARRRLLYLADWQAAWARDGWKILRVEFNPGGGAVLDVDGQTMGLRGRIDRIDHHPLSKEFAILDYKVGAKKSPQEAHYSGGKWKNLQLPLYRHLTGELITRGRTVRLGYVHVGHDRASVGAAFAEWDKQRLAEADEAAREIVRAVWRGEFEEIGDHPPTDGVFANIFGTGILHDAEDEDEEAEEGGET